MDSSPLSSESGHCRPRQEPGVHHKSTEARTTVIYPRCVTCGWRAYDQRYFPWDSRSIRKCCSGSEDSSRFRRISIIVSTWPRDLTVAVLISAGFSMWVCLRPRSNAVYTYGRLAGCPRPPPPPLKGSKGNFCQIQCTHMAGNNRQRGWTSHRSCLSTSSSFLFNSKIDCQKGSLPSKNWKFFSSIAQQIGTSGSLVAFPLLQCRTSSPSPSFWRSEPGETNCASTTLRMRISTRANKSQ